MSPQGDSRGTGGVEMSLQSWITSPLNWQGKGPEIGGLRSVLLTLLGKGEKKTVSIG